VCAKLVARKNAKGKCNWLKVNKRQTGQQQTLGITQQQAEKNL